MLLSARIGTGDRENVHWLDRPDRSPLLDATLVTQTKACRWFRKDKSVNSMKRVTFRKYIDDNLQLKILNVLSFKLKITEASANHAFKFSLLPTPMLEFVILDASLYTNRSVRVFNGGRLI